MAEGSKGFLIPWTCLKDCEISPAKTVYDKPGQRKTFAQALGTTCDIPLSKLPTPCIKWYDSNNMKEIWYEHVMDSIRVGIWLGTF